jgi:hypothetical protein
VFRLIAILFLLLIIQPGYSQPSDFIVVKKKNGRAIKSFMPGNDIDYYAISDHNIIGTIVAIKNDSIFVRMYDIRLVMDAYGLRHLDTLGSYMVANKFSEIQKIKIYNRKNFTVTKIEQIAITGGVGYIALNIFNGAYLNQPITSSQNLKRLSISAAAIAFGIFIKKFFRMEDFYSTGKNKIEYVRMNRN